MLSRIRVCQVKYLFQQNNTLNLFYYCSGAKPGTLDLLSMNTYCTNEKNRKKFSKHGFIQFKTTLTFSRVIPQIKCTQTCIYIFVFDAKIMLFVFDLAATDYGLEGKMARIIVFQIWRVIIWR